MQHGSVVNLTDDGTSRTPVPAAIQRFGFRNGNLGRCRPDGHDGFARHMGDAVNGTYFDTTFEVARMRGTGGGRGDRSLADVRRKVP